MKHQKKRRERKREMNRQRKLHETRTGDMDGSKEYLILDEMEEPSLSKVLEAEPVPYHVRKKAIFFTLLLQLAIWAAFLRFVPLHILLRILILAVLTLFTLSRIYWEMMYRFCTGQIKEMRWMLLEDALLLNDDKIPYKSIVNIYFTDTDEILKHHQPGLYVWIMTEDRNFVLLSRRTGTEREIEKSEKDVTEFVFLLGKTWAEYVKRDEEA